jgi:membrane-associated phospholipid phosphatase
MCRLAEDPVLLHFAKKSGKFMLNRIGIVVCALLAFMPAAANAKTDKIEQIGTALAIAEPVFAGGVSLAKNDWTGLLELTVTTGLTVGTAYGMKYVVHEERPDHSDDKSFPSDTAALAFAPANYLWDRYGWRWGLPAYVVAGFVGYSRVEADKHHWWDVAASAGIAFAYSRFVVTPFRRYNIDASVYATPNSVYLGMNYKF